MRVTVNAHGVRIIGLENVAVCVANVAVTVFVHCVIVQVGDDAVDVFELLIN